MAVWQQKKHGLLSSRVLRRGLFARGHTICLMARQCVSERQPRNTCSESKFPPQRKTSAPRRIGFVLSLAITLYEYPIGLWSCFIQQPVCSNYFHSIAQIPDWPWPAPATALAAHNTLLIMLNSSQATKLNSYWCQGVGGISGRDTL